MNAARAALNTTAALNAAFALGTAGFSVAATLRPGLALTPSEEVDDGVRFYSRAYAARALPLGLITAAAALTAPPAAIRPLLLVSGLAQAGDAALGVMRRNPGMTVGAGLSAAVHLLTAALWSKA